MKLVESMDYLPHKGHSMWPLICEGDEVGFRFFERPVTISQCESGQIVLHKDQSEWMVHRVVEIGGRKVLKGDFSNSYFFEMDEVVWAQTQSCLDSLWMAKVSASAYHSDGWLRKWKKLILWAGGKWLRWRCSNRFLKSR